MPTKTFLSNITTVILCLLLQSSLYAEIYKWTDEKGQVHYGDHPGNTGAEQVTIRKNETTKPRVIKTDKNTQLHVEESAKSKPPILSIKDIPAKERRRLCNEAKSDITAISSRGRMREINKKGEYIYLSEQQRQQRLSTARKKQNKFCR